jgi:hypothetical protein
MPAAVTISIFTHFQSGAKIRITPAAVKETYPVVACVTSCHVAIAAGAVPSSRSLA